MAKKKQGIQVSVVISAKNEEKLLPACLESLRRQRTRFSFEVLVVDNNSSDGTAKAAKKLAEIDPRIKLFRQKKPGSPAARNKGAKEAEGEILLFTDADCSFPENWLEEMCAPFFEPQRLPLLALGGKTLSAFQNQDKPNLWERYLDTLFQDWESDREEAFPGFLPWAPTCNLAVRKDAFQALGGFEEAWKSAAYDVDFCWRLVLSGGYLGFTPRAVVYHQRRASLRSLLRQVENYGYYNQILLRTYEKILHYHPVSTRKERLASKLRRIREHWKSTRSVKDLGNRGLDSLVQLSLAKGALRASLSPGTATRSLNASRAGDCPKLLELLPPAYRHLHSQGWCYWKDPAALEEGGDLILFRVKERSWYRLNESAWKIWEVKAEKGQSEDAARALGQSEDDEEILRDIDACTLDLRRMRLLPTGERA